MIVNCLHCNTAFEKRLCDIKRTKNSFCSSSCAASHNNRGKVKNKPTERTCRKCSNTFTSTKQHRSRVFCQQCLNGSPTRTELYKSLTLEYFHNQPHLIGKQKHPSWLNAQIRQFNRIWNKKLRKLPCANCGYSKHVELAHRHAITSFPKTATLGEINAESNNVPLCPNCHWEFDHELLVL